MNPAKASARCLVPLLAAITLFSGIVDIYSVIGPPLREKRLFLLRVLPLEFIRLSRYATLLIGFFLIISSFNIAKRKKRAWQLVTVLSALSIFSHIFKGLDYGAALSSLILLVLLYLARRNFTVKSSIPDLRHGLERLAISLGVALFYGVIGFYLLDRRQFGINFGLWDSIKKTLLLFSLFGDPKLIPRTRYARWFLNSIYFQGIVSLVYGFYALYRPVAFRLQTLPQERAEAKQIIELYGRSSLDFFKIWPDKSFMFSPTRKAFLAYAVSGNVALVLADPVGPEDEIKPLISAFLDMCRENDWRFCFYQVLPDFLPVYRELGFKALKIGDEAVVDLQKFNLAGKSAKHLRHKVNLFDKEGYRTRYYEPEISADLIYKLRSVSDDWLRIQGRRERGFSLGQFDPDYLKSTPIFTVEGAQGKIVAFANIIPSYRKGEATIDLMRRCLESPNGIMEYLFIKLFALTREQGYKSFSLGLSPLAGVGETADATPEEKVIHFFYQNFNRIFSYKGLRTFKAKFANVWEPRYLIYRNILNLPEITLALVRISEIEM